MHMKKKMTNTKIIIAIVVCAGLFSANLSFAATNARDYIPMPAGTFLFCNYFKHITANTLFSGGKKVSDDYNFTENLGIFRPVYYANLGNALYGDGGLTVDPQALILFGDAGVDGAAVGNHQVSSSGIADPILLATFWFVNDTKNKFWVGFTPYVTLPLGDYDKGRTFNLGNNRWAFKPELGIVKGFGERAYFDLVINGEFYTDNNDFNTGSNLVKKSQDPILGIETHLSYDITKNWYASLDYFYTHGGETKVAGIKQNDVQDSHGLGLSLFWLINSNNQLMFEYRDDFAVKNGLGTNTFGARWAYFF